MTLQKSRWMRGPEGRSPKREPSPGGLGINPEDDRSAVGAAQNLTPPTALIRGMCAAFSYCTNVPWYTKTHDRACKSGTDSDRRPHRKATAEGIEGGR